TLVIDRQEWSHERARLRVEGAVEALRDAGEPFTEEQVKKAYHACYRTHQSMQRQERDISFKDQVQMFVQGIADGLLERISRDTFARILNRYADAFLELPPVLADGVPEMLQTLKEQGYRIGLISNTGMTPGRLFRVYMEDLDIIHFFEHVTFSDEILLAKPSPAIFLHTLASMGCPTDKAVHVGDHLRNDIAAAQQVGMGTIWLEGFDDSDMNVTPTATIRRIADLPEALEKLRAI
ncbi:HAD family hydrolase, partial [Chloroflexota bacterium]